jgi:hypothetical protein
VESAIPGLGADDYFKRERTSDQLKNTLRSINDPLELEAYGQVLEEYKNDVDDFEVVCRLRSLSQYVQERMPEVLAASVKADKFTRDGLVAFYRIMPKSEQEKIANMLLGRADLTPEDLYKIGILRSFEELEAQYKARYNSGFSEQFKDQLEVGFNLLNDLAFAKLKDSRESMIGALAWGNNPDTGEAVRVALSDGPFHLEETLRALVALNDISHNNKFSTLMRKISSLITPKIKEKFLANRASIDFSNPQVKELMYDYGVNPDGSLIGPPEAPGYP